MERADPSACVFLCLCVCLCQTEISNPHRLRLHLSKPEQRGMEGERGEKGLGVLHYQIHL